MITNNKAFSHRWFAPPLKIPKLSVVLCMITLSPVASSKTAMPTFCVSGTVLVKTLVLALRGELLSAIIYINSLPASNVPQLAVILKYD